jgi:hypothetical protein
VSAIHRGIGLGARTQGISGQYRDECRIGPIGGRQAKQRGGFIGKRHQLGILHRFWVDESVQGLKDLP